MIDIKMFARKRAEGTGRGGSTTPWAQSDDVRHALSADKATFAEQADKALQANDAARAAYADKARALAEDSPAYDEFLRKDKEDTAKELINFLKGVTIGDIKISYDEKNGALSLTRVSGSDKKANLYATGGLTAFGAGSSQSGGSESGGTSYERLDRWSDYTTAKAAAVLSAFLGNDLNERLKKVEGGALTSVDWSIIRNKPTSMPASDVPAWAKAATKPSYVWSEITGKPNEFNPAMHSHSFASLTGKPNTLQGYGITDAASISHMHAFSALTNKPTTVDGYGIVDTFKTHREVNFAPDEAGYYAVMTTKSGIDATWRHVISMDWSKNDSVNWISQLALPTHQNESVYYRKNEAVGKVIKDAKWIKIWDEKNLTKLSQLTDDVVAGKYLSLAGGTMQNTSIVKNLNAEFLGGTKLMGVKNTQGITQSFARGNFNDINNYFGNGNIVVCDPQAANGLSANDTIFSLGDSPWRNIQLVFPYPIGGMYYRYNLDGKWSAFRHFAFVDDNVASATKLQNMRKIWGQDFDGTGNVDGMLTVKHTGYSGVKLISTGDESSYRCQCAGGNEWVFGGYPTRFFLWNNAAKHVFSILNNGNVVIGDTEVDSPYKLNVKGTMRIGDSLLLAGTEYCDITTIRNANSAIKNAAVTAAAIRHALDFAWYGTHYQVGNIRGGADNSLGFGITRDSSNLIARFHESGSEFYGNLTVDGYLSLANNVGLTLKDKEGSNQRAVFISSSNTVYFGCNDRPLYTLFEGDELQFNVYNKGWQNALVISRDRTAIFTGNVLAQGGVTAYTTSDRRLKANIKAVDSMRIIRSLGGTWQFDYKDSGEHSIGFIAQSVKGSVLRNMVYADTKGYLKLNYLDTRLIALAFGAAVQVDDKVERLKKRIKVLEIEIEKLKGGEK